ncbi:MAG: gliding motility protein GldM [Paramuribaculum sp.]|nr:gliding motility protein GldM [Paramuribaculum sp.]
MAESNSRMSPRQKMINLMYIVLTAMLALNVSSDVLNGFTQVQEGLARTNSTVSLRNDAIYSQLQALAEQNPEKAAVWFDKASEVRKESSDIFNLIDSLKNEIVIAADGPEGTIANLQNRDDLETASVIMLNPMTRNGENLRLNVDRYREYIKEIVLDSVKSESIEASLSTAASKREGLGMTRNWEDEKFDSQPVVAAITLLTKLQNDVRYAEGEALTTLLNQVDANDVRVNDLNAFVIPRSRLVMRGADYTADIVLAAVDTTARPIVVVNGSNVPDGQYRTLTSRSGSFDYSGYIELPHADGSVTRHPFESSYTVIDPTATVSATMMNVLYAGIANPISISVPGVPQGSVSATMTNGTLTRNGDAWVARPTALGSDAVVTVTANIDGKSQTVNTTRFRVRKLPDPVAFISYTGANGLPERYKGGRPLSKATLMGATGLSAAIDDDALNIDFSVIDFETVMFDSMGNAMPDKSDGANFSQRQKDRFRTLSRGKRFYISRIRAKGPDGVERTLSPVEVIVN